MAAGAALSFKLRRQDRVAVACCGDGGSSKTDFYAAVNSGGAYKLPLILCVINNGWAISVPRPSQTGAGPRSPNCARWGEHTYEHQATMRISYAGFCLNK